MTQSVTKAGFNEAFINNMTAEELASLHLDDEDPVVKKLAVLIGEFLDDDPEDSSRIDELEDELDEAESKADRLEAEVDVLETERDDLKARIEQLKRELSTVT